LKKGEGSDSVLCGPVPSSGEEDSCRTNNSKNKTRLPPPCVATAAKMMTTSTPTKTRSSSMDELRATGAVSSLFYIFSSIWDFFPFLVQHMFWKDLVCKPHQLTNLLVVS